MNVLDIISLLLNLILGGGGLLVSLATLRQTKRKAGGAEAEKAIAERAPMKLKTWMPL